MLDYSKAIADLSYDIADVARDVPLSIKGALNDQNPNSTAASLQVPTARNTQRNCKNTLPRNPSTSNPCPSSPSQRLPSLALSTPSLALSTTTTTQQACRSAMRDHFTSELVEAGIIALLPINTEINVADIFTKPLGKVPNSPRS
jgi:hypothetical protein